jgi:hypothetical protein
MDGSGCWHNNLYCVFVCNSRDRKSVKKIFECFMIIEPPWATSLAQNGSGGGSVRRSPSDPDGAVPVVKSVFPASYNHPEVLRSAAQFAFPCATNRYVKLIIKYSAKSF